MTIIHDETQTKICRVCHAEKQLKDFYENHSSRDGLKHECKDCTNEHRRDLYNKRRELESADFSRSQKFVRGFLPLSSLTDEEVRGSFITEYDGSRTSTADLRERFHAKFTKELNRRLTDYIREKSPRAVEVIFEIADSDLVEPADRLKAATWLAERIIGKTPEVLKIGMEEAPHESIFESLSGGSREDHRAKQIESADGRVLEAEVVEDFEMDEGKAHTSGLDDGEAQNQFSDNGGQRGSERDDVSNSGRQIEENEVAESNDDEIRDDSESRVDELVRKREEAKALRKRIADNKKRRYVSRSMGVPLDSKPWVIDWQVGDERGKACLLARLVSVEKSDIRRLTLMNQADVATDDVAWVVTEHARMLSGKAELAQVRAARFLNKLKEKNIVLDNNEVVRLDLDNNEAVHFDLDGVENESHS